MLQGFHIGDFPDGLQFIFPNLRYILGLPNVVAHLVNPGLPLVLGVQVVQQRRFLKNSMMFISWQTWPVLVENEDVLSPTWRRHKAARFPFLSRGSREAHTCKIKPIWIIWLFLTLFRSNISSFIVDGYLVLLEALCDLEILVYLHLNNSDIWFKKPTLVLKTFIQLKTSDRLTRRPLRTLGSRRTWRSWWTRPTTYWGSLWKNEKHCDSPPPLEATP